MKRKSSFLSVLVLFAMLILSGCENGTSFDSKQINSSETKAATTSYVSYEDTTDDTTLLTTITTEEIEMFSDDMVVHFIDVGQGDSTFIELPNGEAMLIDAGESDQANKVITYIHSQGYDTIDYVVATHAHSDHIGGLPDVLENFNIENFYMTSAVATTQIYEKMLYDVQNSGANIHDVMAGDVILDEANLLIEVVGPKVIDEGEQNNNSVIVKLTYGDDKFLFTGDAEKSEEDGVWTNIKSNVLKVGHHGSDSSSTSNFLKKVEPKYAVISCGLYNSYGHPDDTVLKRLSERNIDVFRTDLQGTIVFTSNGSGISVNITPFEYIPLIVTTATTQKEQETMVNNSGATYVLNTNTKKIHYAYCSSVNNMKESNKEFTNDYNQAIADGYEPCKKCNPVG